MATNKNFIVKNGLEVGTDITVNGTVVVNSSGQLVAEGSYSDADTAAYLSANGYDTATNIIASITDSAPTTLDTLNELAAALGDDPNFATTVTNSIAAKVSKSGDDITGNLTVSGNVGIGTTTPTNTYGPVLHIRGSNPNLRLDGTASGSWAWISMNTADSGDSRAMGTSSDGSFRITNVRDNLDSGIQFAITSAGNVGVGTSSPDTKLEVAQNSSSYNENGGIRLTDANGSARGNIYYNGSQSLVIHGASAPGGIDPDTIVFSTGGTTPTQRMGISLNGDISFDNGFLWDRSSARITITNPGTNEAGIDLVGANSRFYFNGNRGFEYSITANRLDIGEGIGSIRSKSIMPWTDNAEDLGSETERWRNIYTGDLQLSNEGHEKGNDVDGTKGNWTIQEGEEHLYIINNKNGKKYRFALEEIQ